jgi:hypothetical protein
MRGGKDKNGRKLLLDALKLVGDSGRDRVLNYLSIIIIII